MDKLAALTALTDLVGISEDERNGLELSLSSPEAYLEKYKDRLSFRGVSAVAAELPTLAFADALYACRRNLRLDWDVNLPEFKQRFRAIEGSPQINLDELDEEDECPDWIEWSGHLAKQKGFTLVSIAPDEENYELFFVKSSDAATLLKGCEVCGFVCRQF